MLQWLGKQNFLFLVLLGEMILLLWVVISDENDTVAVYTLLTITVLCAVILCWQGWKIRRGN